MYIIKDSLHLHSPNCRHAVYNIKIELNEYAQKSYWRVRAEIENEALRAHDFSIGLKLVPITLPSTAVNAWRSDKREEINGAALILYSYAISEDAHWQYAEARTRSANRKKRPRICRRAPVNKPNVCNFAPAGVFASSHRRVSKWIYARALWTHTHGAPGPVRDQPRWDTHLRGAYMRWW